MLVLLDHDENILEFLDDDLANYDITDVYKGYKSLDLTYVLQDIVKDKYLFRQGNKIFTDNCLFVINNECSFDYISKEIKVDAEEIISELNYVEPFYIYDSKFSDFVTGNTIKLSTKFVKTLLSDFYEVTDTYLPTIPETSRILTVYGTITVYNLLKEIESETGLVFKREYSIENNEVIKKISLVSSDAYGVTHSQLIESITLGENTNKLSYKSDESKNALGIMAIISSEDTDTVKYSTILKQFYNLDINNEKVEPTLNNIVFDYDTFKNATVDILAKTEMQGYLPEITINKTRIGIGQYLELLASYILGNELKLRLISTSEYTTENNYINAQFSISEIKSIANIVKQYCSNNKETPVNIKTNHGAVNTEILIYIFMNYIVNNKQVIVNTEKYPLLSKISSDFIQENIYTTENWENFEYMPFIYTQNASDNNNIPYSVPIEAISGANCYDIDNYISESLPVMKIKKIADASNIFIEVIKQNISQDSPRFFKISFKNVNLIQNDSEIEIDFNKKTIKFMKYVETTETVTEESTTANNNVITVNHMPSCSHCRGTPYKRYTKSWVKKCPFCGSTNLKDNPKKVYEGEITCGSCDADFCGYCGYEKLKNARKNLTPASANTTTSETKTITKGEYKEVTASEDNTESSDTKIGLYECITEDSELNSLYGDVSIMVTGATLESLTCDSTKLYEMAPFPYIKQKNTQYIYAPISSADFNYTHVNIDTAKLEAFETTEQSVEEVLIGCWKKLNGSGDNTAWLEKSEDIEVDLVEIEDTNYDVGDFVYIKLPDTRIFKAQITETSYNPKLLSEKSIKIGNVVKESLL